MGFSSHGGDSPVVAYVSKPVKQQFKQMKNWRGPDGPLNPMDFFSHFKHCLYYLTCVLTSFPGLDVGGGGGGGRQRKRTSFRSSTFLTLSSDKNSVETIFSSLSNLFRTQ
jgi:hypothetical protein